MSIDRHFDLVITIVNRGFADQVMDAAKKGGAQGGTVVYARGAGIHEAEKFFGISIQPEKEIVIIIVERDNRSSIMQEISKEAGLNTPGRGLSFSLPVTHVTGIVHLEK